MPRPVDEPIPPDEALFRGVGDDEVAGTCLLPHAIDMQGTSVVRDKYGSAADALDIQNGLTRVAEITPARIPPPVQSPTTADQWTWFVVDDPEPNDDAHAELRTRKTTDQGREHRRAKKKQVKLLLRAALAGVFRVLPAAQGPAA